MSLKDTVFQLRICEEEKKKWKDFQKTRKFPSLASLIRTSINAFIVKELKITNFEKGRSSVKNVWIKFNINSDLKKYWRSYAEKEKFTSLSDFIRYSTNKYIKDSINYDKFPLSEDSIESIPIIFVSSLFSVKGLNSPDQRMKTEIILNPEEMKNLKTLAVISGSSISLCSDTIIRALDIKPDLSKRIIVTNLIEDKILSNPCQIEIIYKGLYGNLTFFVIKNLENIIGTPILLGRNCIDFFLNKESEFLFYVKNLKEKDYTKNRTKLEELEKECEQNIKDIETFKHI